MPRHTATSTFRALDLSSAHPEPLHRQLYDEIRRAILAGRLPAGARMPASRELAAASRVSRNTVLSAYEQLLAEGYIQGRPGSGTFVVHSVPDSLVPERVPSPGGGAADADAAPLSRRGEQIRAAAFSVPGLPDSAKAFRIGLPALDRFPMDIWRRLTDRCLRHASAKLLAYGDPAGHEPLRAGIAAHLAAARGVRCSPANVVIVNGSQQAVHLCAQLLADPGDSAWMEEPGYFAARAALQAMGLACVPVPVDRDGMQVAAGVERAPRARIVYCTPSHQNPTGATLGLARRMLLLQWARRSGAWILEDDNASEYRYRGRPLAALQGIDPGGRVIYLGTFSKVLFSSLRLGYLVLPDELVEPFTRAIRLQVRCTNQILQTVLADFMAEGHFARHLRRMRTLYAARLEALERAVARHAADVLELEPMEGGLNQLAWLPPGLCDLQVTEEAGRRGIFAVPLSQSAAGPLARRGVVLGFAGVDEPELERGIERLADAVRAVIRRGPAPA